MKGITTMAAAPMSHFLAARRRCPVTVERNMFADLADAFPRAWACLGAVALAYGGGGRWPYRAPAAPVPELPVAEFEAPRADNRENAVVLSGIDTRFDPVEYLLAHDVPILTANYMLRTHEVWVRRREYRATVAKVMEQLEAAEQATEARQRMCREAARRAT